jgi:flavin-dependent dehydrogenase
MRKSDELDLAVMIVGGGPAGISTWMHLQKEAPQLAGRSIVIEKAVFPRDKLCGGGLCIWAVEVLQRLGVNLDIPSLFLSDLEFIYGKEIDRLHEDNYFRIVRRADFDHALAKAAVNRGLALHEEEIFIDVVRTQQKLIVKTNKGEYGVQTLVGADGAFSAVRRKMIPSQKRYLSPTLQVLAPANSRYDTEFAERKTVVDLTPINEGLQGYLWHVPCLKDNIPSIAHGICDFRVCPDRPRADIKKLFSRELESRHIYHGPKTWSSYPIPWHSDDDILSRPNVILVGDAAGVEPAFGGGIHLSLSYGEVAAGAIMDAFQTDDFSFCDYTQKVQSHQVGKHISKCTRLAFEMYGGSLNPLDAAREVFDPRCDPAAFMRQLLFRHLEIYPQLSEGTES